MPRKRSYHRVRPGHKAEAYIQLWRIVDGAIADCFHHHPDYLTNRGQFMNAARRSLTKRIVGTVMGFAAQAAGGRHAVRPAVAAAPEPPPSTVAPHGDRELPFLAPVTSG